MSYSELTKWKKKAQQLSVQLKEKEQILREYKKTIQQGDHLLQDVIEKLSLELKAAHQIHHILLPTSLPVISGCKFSFKFKASDAQGCGKDFYEIVPHLASKRFSVTMFSCLSYSLSALLVSAKLKMMNYTGGVDHLKPHEFILNLTKEMNWNKKTPNASLPRMDLFHALIDQKTYEMSYCLLGDIAVFIRSAQTEEIEKVKPCLTAGTLNNKNLNNLKSQTVPLNRGDRVVICSPGVLKSSQGSKSYSLSSLKKTIDQESGASVHELRNHIMYDMQNLSQKKSIVRDQSVLVMEVSNRVLKLTKKKAK